MNGLGPNPAPSGTLHHASQKASCYARRNRFRFAEVRRSAAINPSEEEGPPAVRLNFYHSLSE
jgi:hypothetical protein